MPIRCISTGNPKVVYAGVFISACAIYPSFAGVITWLSNNLSGSYKRSVGMAIQIGVGNLGGVSIEPLVYPGSITHNITQAMASNFYRQKDSPRYIMGHALELAFVCLGIIAGLILVFGYRRINKSRERQMEAGGADNVTVEELSSRGDKALTWRYMY